MRTAIAAIGLLTALVATTPARALDRAPMAEKGLLAVETRELRQAAVRRAGRTFAAFEVGEQAVTLTAYGRRARARAMHNLEDVQHARAMGKVFNGAPQPALLTVEFSLKF